MNHKMLQSENHRFHRRGGVSQNNRCAGFRPAFQDSATGTVYLSCFPNGLPAPVHLLDGLPDEVVLARDVGGRVTAVRRDIVAGFVRAEAFYTREEAAQRMKSELFKSGLFERPDSRATGPGAKNRTSLL